MPSQRKSLQPNALPRRYAAQERYLLPVSGALLMQAGTHRHTCADVIPKQQEENLEPAAQYVVLKMAVKLETWRELAVIKGQI